MNSLMIWISLLFVFGTAIGSFLNVVISRVPIGESVVSPRSHCVFCQHTITWIDNIPILSWIILRGRCRYCKSTISVRYLLVEIATGLLFVAVPLALATQQLLPPRPFSLVVLCAFLLFISVALALAAIDAQRGVLPNVLILIVLITGLVLSSTSLIAGQWRENAVRMMLGGLMSFGGYLLVKLIIPQGLGWGDVKLAAVLGMFLGWVGWGAFIIGTLAAFAWGTLFSLGLMIMNKAQWHGTIYFGPWMVTGALTGILCGENLWNVYISIIKYLVS